MLLDAQMSVTDRLVSTVRQLTTLFKQGTEVTLHLRDLLESARKEPHLQLRVDGERVGKMLMALAAEFGLDIRANAAVMSQTVDTMKTLLHGDEPRKRSRGKGR